MHHSCFAAARKMLARASALLCLLKLTACESACEETYTKKQFVVASPNYPQAYPANFECTYFIEGSKCARKYNFQFLDFDLEDDAGCSRDRLEVGAGERFCGTKSGVKTVAAPEGSLALRFLTDGENSGRGFRLLVTRLPCEGPAKNFEWRQFFGPAIPRKFCCKQFYNTKHFYLSSPSFPHSNQPNDCIYHVHKANRNVCRLRIHFIYFQIGDHNCNGGFLEINGKRICGCQTGLKLLTPFDSYSLDPPKILRFKSDGFQKPESFTGFALEVFQDECPNKYSPEGLLPPRIQRSASVRSAKLVRQTYNQPHRHFYFFSDPEEDREETTYADTSDANFHLSDREGCRAWGASQFAELAEGDLWRNTRCRADEPASRKCSEVNAVKGYLHSPGYPFYYPGRLDVCFRFKRQPGYCAVKLMMVDFQVEYSEGCSKDYLLLGGKFKYCGNQLHGTISTLDLGEADFEDVVFVTDSYYCDRGFKAIYEQIPCVGTTVTPPVTQTPLMPCNSVIKDGEFLLNFYTTQQDTCVYTIVKSDMNICRLDLQKLITNLDCNNEDIFVNGRSICSLTETDNFSVNFKEDSISIVYKRFAPSSLASGLKLQLSGKQTSENCDFYNFPEVPAEKLNSEGGYGLFVILKGPKPDVCGIITNATFTSSPQESCEMLLKRQMIESCFPATPNAFEVPEAAENLHIHLGGNKSEVISVERVSCDVTVL